MSKTVAEIKSAFSGRLIGSSIMKKRVCETLLFLPDNLVEFVTQNIWFISSPSDSWAFTFRGSDIQNQFLIILSDELLAQDKSQIRFTILHEIGHVILGHRNSMGFPKQSESEIRHQEITADQFANQFLPK